VCNFFSEMSFLFCFTEKITEQKNVVKNAASAANGKFTLICGQWHFISTTSIGGESTIKNIFSCIVIWDGEPMYDDCDECLEHNAELNICYYVVLDLEYCDEEDLVCMLDNCADFVNTLTGCVYDECMDGRSIFFVLFVWSFDENDVFMRW